MMAPTLVDSSRLGDRFVERRREPRSLVNIPARVKGLNPLTSIGPSTPATVVDISHHGLRLCLDREFLPGASLQLVVSKHVVLATVRHCFRSGSKFMVGVELKGLIGASKDGEDGTP